MLRSLLIARLPPQARAGLARLRRSPVGYRLARGAFWSAMGAFATRGFGLLAFILAGRILGREDLGEFGMVQSSVLLFQTFAGLGLGLAATKYVAEFRNSDPGKAGRVVALSELAAFGAGATMALMAAIASPWLAARVLNAPQLAHPLAISSLVIFMGAIGGAQTGALGGFEAFRTIARINLVVGVLSLPLMVSGAWFGGVIGAVWSLVGAQALMWFLTHRALRAEAAKAQVCIVFAGCGREWGMLWRFSLPAVLAGAMVVPVQWLANAMLVHVPGGYGELGLYSAAMRIKQAPELVLSTLLSPLLPVLSEQFGRKDGTAFRKTVDLAYLSAFVLMVPASLLVAGAPQLVLLPFGADFRDGTTIVQWLFLHCLLLGLFAPMGAVLSSQNRMWTGLAYNLSWGAAFLGLAYFLVPRHGATGLAAAFGLAYALTALPFGAYVWLAAPALAGSFPLIRMTLAIAALYAAAAFAARTGGVFAGLAVAAVCSVLLLLALRQRGLLRLPRAVIPDGVPHG